MKRMASRRELAKATNMRVYFCDPHSPWQKGSCENINGLLRQFLPKGTDWSQNDQDSLDSIADLLNNWPRQTQGWFTPYENFKEFMQAIEQQQTATIHRSVNTLKSQYQSAVLHFGVETAVIGGALSLIIPISNTN